MGSWLSAYEITGGMYGGRNCPAGSLTDFFVDYCGTGSAGNEIAGQRAYQSYTSGFKTWGGAYGMNDDLLKAYCASHQDGQIHRFELAEIEIPKPDGAQYYKQTLVVEGYIQCFAPTHSTVTYAGITYEADSWQTFYGVQYLKRREYPTPTGTPVDTQICNLNRYITFWQYSGDIVAVPRGRTSEVYSRALFFFGTATYNNVDYFCCGFYWDGYGWLYGHPDDIHSSNGGGAIGEKIDRLKTLFGGDFEPPVIDDPFKPPTPTDPGDNPPPSPGPGHRIYDPIPIPDLPTITATGAGLLTLYRPSGAILRLLASELYSDNIIQIVVNYFTSINDMIAGLSIVPFLVPVSGRGRHRIGQFTSDISMDVISNQFFSIDCGTIFIEPYYNAFLDQSPYTKLIVWLPYIGYQEIDTDDVMGQYMNITYHCDCLGGYCVAYISTGVAEGDGPNVRRVIAQFSGNMAIQVPTAGASYDSMISSAINILTTAASMGIGKAGVAASMSAMEASGAEQAAIDAVPTKAGVHYAQAEAGCAGDVVRAMKPEVTRNGTPGSTAGYLGVQKPYLIKVVPRSSVPDNFIHMKGYQSNNGGTLSSYSGYCEVQDIQLNNIPATIPEINEIYELLKGGILL